MYKKKVDVLSEWKKSRRDSERKKWWYDCKRLSENKCVDLL